MRVTAIVPSLNPDERLPKVIEGLVGAGFGRIIIVDDGSREDRRHFFDEALDIGGERCVFLRHSRNLGKGRALKTAFNWFLNNKDGDVGVVTLDADGQHTPADVLRCAEALEQHPDALIIGARNFNAPGVPKRNAAGNKFTAGVFRAVCGIHVHDTQTGLRGISAQFAGILMNVSGERFEFETNMLLETKRNEIEIVEVPIETVYINENATSHFHPIRDSISIYALILKYVSSSVISWLVDYLIFGLLSHVLAAMAPEYALLIATVGARIVSSLCNFLINKRVVFKSDESLPKTLAKYYIVAAVQVLASYGGVYLLSQLLHIPSMIAKPIVDLILFLISFKVQQTWVFKKRKEKAK